MKTSNNNENIVLVEKSSFDEKIAVEKDKERLCTASVYERLKKDIQKESFSMPFVYHRRKEVLC